ncbi:ABC transporter permease [Cryptosporangium aurantiacum]|uniref:Transport permease protein n=1 Tax=Cryptosporangium aurantiacum TaxID=134849 RepID=A0A1M7H3F6_9ACTN|nr:ABC transporter permease [Cryptosporangium aurantiacum]SHM22938.1 ABC-2 type transport system permease protein [Cryptosporangium aurantiacum]
MSEISAATTIFTREIVPVLRNPFGLLFTIAQPLVFLLLFGPLLTDVPGTGDESPWQWFVPGILVMTGLFATAGAGYAVQTELSGGSMERILVTPVSRASILTGKTMKEVFSLLVQAVMIVLVAIPFGFRLYPLEVLAGLALLSLTGIGLGSLAIALAVVMRKQQEAFWAAHQFFLFPLVLLSGVLLPVDQAPGWLETASRLNPLTYLVEAERALFAGEFLHSSVLWGTIGAGVTAVIGLVVGTRTMRTATL